MDIGAVFNLTGDAWVQRMEGHVPKNLPIHYDELPEPQGVMGVGKHASTATHAASVPVGMSDQGIEPDENFRYKATAITNSDVPALLGLQSMMASNCILDLRPGKMHMYTAEDANALEIKYVSKKEHLVGRLKMVMAQSGHLMLPCSQFQTPPSSPSRRANQPSSSTQPTRSRSPMPIASNRRVTFKNPPMSCGKLTVPVGLTYFE